MRPKPQYGYHPHEPIQGFIACFLIDSERGLLTTLTLATVVGFIKASTYTRTELPYIKVTIMDIVSVNKFRDNLKNLVEQVVSQHEPLKVTRRAGEAFVVISAEDWEREQETLHVLQNKDLMQQISASLSTHANRQGYKPTDEQLNEITGL